MFALILSWLGPILSGPLLSSALNAYKAKLSSTNDAEKIAADLAVQQAQVDAQREMLEQQTVSVEEGKWFPFVRWGFAFPFMLFNFKVIVWDRMLHWGITDPLSSDLTSLESVIIAAYFGHSAVSILSGTIGRAITKTK